MRAGGIDHVRRSKNVRCKQFQVALLTGLLAFGLQANGARAEEEEENVSASAAVGAAAGISSLIYAPLKITYAVLGLVVGGIAWGLSAGDNSVFYAVITPSVRGDYVVTPDHIRGDRGLAVLGREPAYRQSGRQEDLQDSWQYSGEAGAVSAERRFRPAGARAVGRQREWDSGVSPR